MPKTETSLIERLIDNAATASQCDFDEVTREAIQLNIVKPLRARVAELEAAAGQAAYNMISGKYGRDLANRVASTGWQWPDDAPDFIDTTIYRLCAALKETSHADR